MHEIWRGFVRIMTNWRLLILILIITGFWMVQQQLYATMPKYVIRMAGETANRGGLLMLILLWWFVVSVLLPG